MKSLIKYKYTTLTVEDRRILERVRAKHRQFTGHSAVVETQDARDASVMYVRTLRRYNDPIGAVISLAEAA